MEQPDGHTGYEEYDQYYGNPYESASEPEYTDEDVPDVAGVSDPHRVDIIEISEHDAHDAFYSPRAHTGYDRVSLKAYLPDPRRVSIHPLGVSVCPPGVRQSEWRLLDADRLLTRYEPTTYSDYAAHDSSVQKPQPATGDGGSVREQPSELPASEPATKDSSEMPFLDHLEEFRWSLLKSIFVIVIAMVASWFLADQFYSTITRLAKAAELPLIFTKLMEPIMIRLQMTFVMGIVISLPFVFFFLWSFIAPGLYDNEKKWVLPLALGATIFFFIGASVAYFVIIPYMLTFIKEFMPPDIEALITIGDFISNLLKFTLLFGVMFELPLVSYFLAKLGILKYSWMIKYRKFAIVVIFVVGAVLTPPDPMSQIVMAAPLILLYEISIQVARFAGRKTILSV